MPATPVWFGPKGRLLFGWFHRPENGRARGGVVICPPLGRDYMRGHYALRRMAARLEEHGLCALRFDYDGTGDSAGDSTDPDRVSAWLASVGEAVALLRGLGLGWVALAGMRVGATIASVAAEQDGLIDGLILVDPVLSGRSFVAEERALAALALGVDPTRLDGSIETPGVVYDAATVKDLRMLEIGTDAARSARKILVLTRKDKRVDQRLARRLSGSDVDWDEATGQEGLLDAEAPHQLLPVDDIERVVGWVRTVAPTQESPVLAPPRATAVEVTDDPRTGAVVESPITLGPTGLFGMTAEVPGRSSGPVIVLLNVSTEPHIGPARLWVELARHWAPLGLRSVRVDLSGLGESPARPGEPEFVIRLPVAFKDVSEIVGGISPEDPSNVVLVGLCSSGYQALESALVLRPRGVVALNPVLTFQPPETMAGGLVDPRRRVALPRGAVVQQFHHQGPLSPLRERFPDLGWKVRTLMAVRRRPSVWLRDLTASGVDLMLVCGDREARPFRNGMSARAAAKIAATGRFRFEYIPGLDHGLLVADHRSRVRTMVTEHLVDHFAAGRPAPVLVSNP